MRGPIAREGFHGGDLDTWQEEEAERGPHGDRLLESGGPVGMERKYITMAFFEGQIGKTFTRLRVFKGQ